MSRQGRKTAGGAPSQRQLRVGEVVRHALTEILQRGDLPDPVLERIAVTVPEVRMSPDLKNATVYVMPLGGLAEREVLDALERGRRHLRALLAKRIELKFVPDLVFALDERFDAAEEVDRLLRSPQVARDLDEGEDG